MDQIISQETQYEPQHDITNKMSVRPVKTQISLVWSESSLCAHWVAKDPWFLHADSKDFDQTGRMPRLMWVFAGRTLILLVLSCCSLRISIHCILSHYQYLLSAFNENIVMAEDQTCKLRQASLTPNWKCNMVPFANDLTWSFIEEVSQWPHLPSMLSFSVSFHILAFFPLLLKLDHCGNHTSTNNSGKSWELTFQNTPSVKQIRRVSEDNLGINFIISL